MIDGVDVIVGAEAVCLTARRELRVISSAFAGGGLATARTIVNLHVPKNFACADAGATVLDFARRRGLPAPYVGMLTSAWTEKAQTAVATAGDVRALVVATIGLSNASAAGLSARAAALAGTINTVVVVDADPEPAAMVNLVMTVTEVKTALLLDAGLKSLDGHPASGTSTDAVVVAATGRGPRCAFGGPISDLGWAVARAARDALGTGVRRWLEDHR